LRLVIAGARPWNRRAFEAWVGRCGHDAMFIGAPAELDVDRLHTFQPDYVFFVHWSWRIPSAVFEPFECIGFHMTDLPFGRGGSPLQNLIALGIKETRLSAFRIGAEMDAGPIYLKRPLQLAGSAEQVFERASALAFDMIDEIVLHRVVPTPQVGAPVLFERRTPAQSRIDAASTLEQLYDFIRMLDAEGYPAAFMEHGEFRLEFTGADLQGEALTARVRITRPGDGKAT
jgi:methionyl-tRNA formyltransferase